MPLISNNYQSDKLGSISAIHSSGESKIGNLFKDEISDISPDHMNKRWRNKDLTPWGGLNYLSENNSNTASNYNNYHLQKPKHDRTGIEIFNNQCITHAREKI